MSADKPYQLLDCGDERKLEDLGVCRIVRQAAQAYWRPELGRDPWGRVEATHKRSKTGGGHWEFHKQLPESWIMTHGGLRFRAKLTDFGHIGLFPEQAANWSWITDQCAALDQPEVLNLFGYTGGSTLAAARGGARVTHVDASKGVVSWARENATLNKMGEHPIRWIVEDVSKFVNREVNRGNRYQGVILDPPSFGRGPKGQTWKIEQHLIPFLQQLKKILEPLGFILLSCHTPGYSPLALVNILNQVFEVPVPEITSGEMVAAISNSERVLPSGTYAAWSKVG